MFSPRCHGRDAAFIGEVDDLVWNGTARKATLKLAKLGVRDDDKGRLAISAYDDLKFSTCVHLVS